jgi:hypothetical protein
MRRFAVLLGIVLVALIAIAYIVVRDAAPAPRSEQTARTSEPSASTEPQTAAVIYSHAVSQDDPAAFWRLNDHDKTTAHDTMGRFEGTYMGSPAQGNTLSPALGTGTSFDGVDDHVTANTVTSVTSWPGYTMEAWVRLTQDTQEEHLVAFNNAKGGNGPGILHDQPTRKFKFRDCEGKTCAQVFSKTVPQIGDLYHLVVSVDPNDQGAFYVNGELQARFVSKHRPPIDGLFTIGAEYDTGPAPESFFQGDIGDVAIYQHSLDAAAVNSHYEAGKRS